MTALIIATLLFLSILAGVAILILVNLYITKQERLNKKHNNKRDYMMDYNSLRKKQAEFERKRCNDY